MELDWSIFLLESVKERREGARMDLGLEPDIVVCFDDSLLELCFSAVEASAETTTRTTTRIERKQRYQTQYGNLIYSSRRRKTWVFVFLKAILKAI